MSTCRLAISEAAFQEVFKVVRDRIEGAHSGMFDMGAYELEWDFRLRVEEGAVHFTDDDTIRLDDLDVVFDRLRLNVRVNIPKLCIGGQCVVPNPFGGCAVRLPELCVFKANPDVTLRLNLDGLIRTELSAEFMLSTRYFVNPARTDGMTDHDAYAANASNAWQVFMNAEWLDIDPIDAPGVVQGIYNDAIEAEVNRLMGPLPGWAKDAVLAVLGALGEVIEGILDVGDDVEEWISDILGVSIGLVDHTVEMIDHYFVTSPVFQFKDLFRVMEGTSELIPVIVPFADVSARITDKEMIITAEAVAA